MMILTLISLSISISIRISGIDLGTTNSAISIIEGGKPVIIPCNGNRIVPSIVGYDKTGKVIIGKFRYFHCLYRIFVSSLFYFFS